jgi:integrase
VLLVDYLQTYISRRDTSAGHVHQLTTHLRQFEKWLVRPAAASDLTAENLNAHLKAMRDDRLSPAYRAQRKKNLLCLWNSLADDDLLTPPPRRKLLRVNRPDEAVEAWTIPELQRLVCAAEKLRGQYKNGIDRAAWWRSYLLAAWDTGLRGCDLRQLRRRDITPGGRVVIVQSKTGRMIACQLSNETMSAIHRTFPPARDLVWPLWGSVEIFRRQARKLIESANLTGSLKRIRSSSGTAAEIAHPGRGHEHLGNTRRVFERHYLARHLLRDQRPSPPPLAV